jgi:PAS domain S-box-containing protein
MTDDSADVSPFQVMADQAPILLWMSGVGAGRTFLNKAWLTFTGRTIEEQLGDGWMDGLHEEDRAASIDAYREAFATRQPFQIEYRLLRADGAYRRLLDRGTPHYSKKGFAGFVGSAVDITEGIDSVFRNSESQLRQLAASLQSSREQERTHLARELHDELGQTLTSLKLELMRTIQALSDVKICPTIIDRLQSMVGLADLSTDSVRRIATALRPPELDHLGLPAAIELEAAAIERRTGIRCRVSVGREPLRLDTEQSTTLFRIFQEALINVARHASASVVRVRLRQSARVFKMGVRDNGRGISKQELASPQSIGLVGMRERAQIHGGQVVIIGHPGKGTTLTVSMPLEPFKRKGAPRRALSGARSHATRASRR